MFSKKTLLLCLILYLVLIFVLAKVFFLGNYWTGKNEKSLLEVTIELDKSGVNHRNQFKVSIENQGKLSNVIKNRNQVVVIANRKLEFIQNGKIKKDMNQTGIQYEIKSTNEISNSIQTNNDVITKKKYMFSLRYYEQLSKATSNLLSLVALSTYSDRQVVMPFVNNSRFSGLPSGTSMSRFMKSRKDKDRITPQKFGNLSTYFDIHHLNNKLRENGYTTLAPFADFQRDCTRLDVVVQFLYNSPQKDLERWYDMPREAVNQVKNKIVNSGGFGECEFAQRSYISKFLGDIKVSKYMCVDPEIIRTAEELETKVLLGAQCIGFVIWKGNGHTRGNFELPHQITKEVLPFHLRHSDRLINIAYRYIREVINRPFISVHVRSERQIMRKGVNSTRNCIRKLTKNVIERLESFHLKKIFLASDLEEYGSGTILSHGSAKERDKLQNELVKSLNKPFVFNPKDYNLYDRGEVAIVEMHILSLGESLFTLGNGNFQQWIIDIFLSHNADDKSLIYKVCETRK